MNRMKYTQGAELPDLAITWRDYAGAIIDFSTGNTFQLKVGHPGQAALVTKTTGIQGYAAAPNVVVAWGTTGELNDIPAGVYHAQLTATRTADGKHRSMTFLLEVALGIL